MRRAILSIAILLVIAPLSFGAGLLIPKDKEVPPLAMLKHHVKLTITEHVAVTEIEQVFRNHTSRQLEATYVFPVPKGASVNSFSMVINGKETKGEVLEADKAREIYTGIVRRMQDPGLLEYVDHQLFRIRVFPIPPRGDQKLKFRYTSMATKEGDHFEHLYPLMTKGKAVKTLEDFSIKATLRSQMGIQNVYSPSHSPEIKRINDQEVQVELTKNEAKLDKNFRLYYQLTEKDVGLTALTYRPIGEEDGYFMMLISPRVKLSEGQQIPRDVVFVVDTSGSMNGEKMAQARKAVEHCLGELGAKDRFAVLRFSTTVGAYRLGLTKATKAYVENARKWVKGLNAGGGTAIHQALQSALELKDKEAKGRTFTVVFFTDGLPTVGITDANQILKDSLAKKDADTRIFTFGVGNDVNATLLDQLAQKTSALSSYVQPNERIDEEVSRFYAKIKHPVLTHLKLKTGEKIMLREVYPVKLPDLFHGTQLTVLGRYTGDGPIAIRLTGKVGEQSQEFVYETSFPKKTDEKQDFVEHLWARRKVGYLLDQIRANGENPELKTEVIQLAKRYGITTPYTSYLVVPDDQSVVTQPGNGSTPKTSSVPRVQFAPIPDGGLPGRGGFGGIPPGGIRPGFPGPVGGPMPGIGGGAPGTVGGTGIGGGFGGLGGGRGGFGRGTGPTPTRVGGGRPAPGGGYVPASPIPTANPTAPSDPSANSTVKPGDTKNGTASDPGQAGGDPKKLKPVTVISFARSVTQKPGQLQLTQLALLNLKPENQAQLRLYQEAQQALQTQDKYALQTGKLGVQLSLETQRLKGKKQVARLQQRVAGRNCFQIGNVWIDEKFTPKTETLTVKALSDAYFAILKHHPEMKDVYQLGQHLVWITPSGTALVIDPTEGKEKLDAETIGKLFAKK